MRENADRVIRFVLNRLEGGGKVHTVAGDSGGTTKWGFSQRWNPDIDVTLLDEEGAVKRALEKYWIPSGADHDPWPLDANAFDCAFNFGADDLAGIRKANPENWQDFLLMRMVRHMVKSKERFLLALLLRCLRLYNWVKTQKGG